MLVKYVVKIHVYCYWTAIHGLQKIYLDLNGLYLDVLPRESLTAAFPWADCSVIVIKMVIGYKSGLMK